MYLDMYLEYREAATKQFSAFWQDRIPEGLRHTLRPRDQLMYHTISGFIALATSSFFNFKPTEETLLAISDTWYAIRLIDNAVDHKLVAAPHF